LSRGSAATRAAGLEGALWARTAGLSFDSPASVFFCSPLGRGAPPFVVIADSAFPWEQEGRNVPACFLSYPLLQGRQRRRLDRGRYLSILGRPSLLMAFSFPGVTRCRRAQTSGSYVGEGAVFRTLIHEYSKKRSTQPESKSKVINATQRNTFFCSVHPDIEIISMS
jgi:hypothetical protein